MDLDLELLASIASGGLGSWQTDAAGRSVYLKSDDCIGCLRDLQRFFRNDDPEARPAFFAVSKYNFARSDLVPLIVTYPDDYDVVYNALKVATFLTMPSSDPLVTTNRALQEQHMQAVREAFLAQDALAAVVGMLAEPLARHPRMDERNAALVQLVMAFLRNLVAIPDAPAAPGPLGASAASKDASRRIKSGLLDRLFSDNVMELLLLLAQHAQQRPFRNEAPVLVETFMHIFCGVEPQQLLDSRSLLEKEQAAQREQEAAAKRAAAKAAHKAAQRGVQGRGAAAPARGGAAGRAAVANTAHLPRLPALPQAAQRQLGAGVAAALARGVVPRHVTQAAPSRHAHSGAVYVRRHSDHSANIVVRHNPNRSELPRLPAVVDDRKAAAQRKDSGGGGAAGDARPQLGAELLVRLDAFLQQFLDGGYDLLMGHVFKELQPGLNISRLTEADFLNFVRLATYCTRYVRLREERTLQAKLRADKGKASAAGGATSGGASPDAPTATAAAAAAAGGDQADGQEQKDQEEGAASPFVAISATMGWDCFHWVTFLWITLSNIEGGGKQKDHGDKNWDLQHASVPLLKEMLLALDLARVAGNAADRCAADRLQRRLLHDDLKESGLLPVLARLIKGYNFRFQPRSHAVDLIETLHVVLGMLDRLSSAESGGFKVKAIARRGGGGRRRKQLAGSGDEAPNSEAGDGQGSPGASGEGGAEGSQGEGDDELAQRRAAVGRSGDPLEEEEEEEGRARRATREVSFEAAKRIRAELAHPAVLHFYAWLLQGYRTNSPFTNHAIVSLFRRIAEPRQQNLEPMLWQISLLRLFEAILSDVSIKRSAAHADLLAFSKAAVRNLFARMVPDLSEVRQRAEALEAELQGIAAARRAQQVAGRDDGDEVDSSERETQRQLRMAQAELKARQNASNALFMEVLFWKAAAVAEDVRNEYNWIGLVDPAEHRRRGGRRGRGTALGDDDASEGEGARFFESFRPLEKKGAFTEEQAAALRAEFERCNGHKDCLDRLVFEFGGQWKKAHISRQLKAMGLAKGKFTEAQEERMRGLYEEHRGKLECFELIAEEIAAGFTANQVKRHLRKIGTVSRKESRGPRRPGKSAFTEEQEQHLRDLFDEHSGRHDRFEKIAEEMGVEGLTAAKVKRQLRKMGVIAMRLAKRQRDAAFDLLVGGSEDDEGEQGGAREGPDGSQQQSAGGSAHGASASDASSASSDSSDASDSDNGSDSDGGSGFESAREDLEGAGGGEDLDVGGSDGEQGGRRVQARAARRLKALAALQKRSKDGGKRRQRQRSPELAGGTGLGPGSDLEDEADGVAAQQAAAAAAAGAASPASNGGGSFVSLADSDVEERPAAAPAAPKAAAKRQRLHKQPPAKLKRSAPAAPEGSDSEAGSGSGSDGGFASARESEPDSEAAGAAPVAKRGGKKHVRPQGIRGSGEDEEQAMQGPQQQSKKARRSRAATGKQQDSTPSAKRKAEQPAGPSSAQKRAALDALRRRRLQAGAGAAEERDADVAMADENEEPQALAPAPAAAKPAGRRLLKKAGGGAAAGASAPTAAPAPLFEDLEDF